MSLNSIRRVRLAARETARDLRKRTTPAEQLLWEAIRNRRRLGYKFLRQHPILHDETGRDTYYVADFYCARVRLAVELDGAIHSRQKAADEQRDQTLRLRGIAVVRFTNHAVQESLESVLAKLEQAVRQREKELAERRKESRDEPAFSFPRGED